MTKLIKDLIKECHVGPCSPIRYKEPAKRPYTLRPKELSSEQQAAKVLAAKLRGKERLKEYMISGKPFSNLAEQDKWLAEEEAKYVRALALEILDKGLKHNHHRPPAAPVVPMLEMVEPEPEDLIDDQS